MHFRQSSAGELRVGHRHRTQAIKRHHTFNIDRNEPGQRKKTKVIDNKKLQIESLHMDKGCEDI